MPIMKAFLKQTLNYQSGIELAGYSMIKKICIFSCLVFFLIGCLSTSGCISASSSTGSTAETSVKSQQQTSQATTSKDKVELNLEKTEIDINDKNGHVLAHLVIGGARAETGSQTIQESDMDAFIKAASQASSEAVSKAKADMTPLIILGLIALAILLFFSGGTRVYSLLKKVKLP